MGEPALGMPGLPPGTRRLQLGQYAHCLHDVFWPEQVDLAVFPAFEGVRHLAQRFTVDPGRTLVIPSGWFHLIVSEGDTVAVNQWPSHKRYADAMSLAGPMASPLPLLLDDRAHWNLSSRVPWTDAELEDIELRSDLCSCAPHVKAQGADAAA